MKDQSPGGQAFYSLQNLGPFVVNNVACIAAATYLVADVRGVSAPLTFCPSMNSIIISAFNRIDKMYNGVMTPADLAADIKVASCIVLYFLIANYKDRMAVGLG